MLKRMKFLCGSISVGAMLASSMSHAATIGFVEDFTGDVAGWEDYVENPLSHAPSGGIDGGGYASTTYNYLGYTSPFGGGPVTFRASSSDMASGGAFVGDYLTEGVGAIQISFRHNAPEDLTLFMRVAAAANYPGAVFVQTLAAPANTWTQVTFAIDPLSPFCIGEGFSCADVLADVANLQFGTDAPAGLVDTDYAYTLDIDRVTILPIPEPGTAVLMGLGLAGLQLAGRRPAGRRPTDRRAVAARDAREECA